MRLIRPSPWCSPGSGPSSTEIRGRPVNAEEQPEGILRLAESLPLANGLTVEFYDCSRPVAGDRWLVALLARVRVEAREDLLPGAADRGLVREFLGEVGPWVDFEMRKERNFIDAREREQVFSDMLRSVRGHALAYIARDGFAKGVLRRQFDDFQRRRNWWR